MEGSMQVLQQSSNPRYDEEEGSLGQLACLRSSAALPGRPLRRGAGRALPRRLPHRGPGPRRGAGQAPPGRPPGRGARRAPPCRLPRRGRGRAEQAGRARAVEAARTHEEGAFRRILGREHRHHLAVAVAVPLFQQLTGVIVIALFSPVLFQTARFGSNAALMGVVILGAVNLASTLVSTVTVNRYGRRPLFLTGGFVMIICQVAVAWIMGSQIGADGGNDMARPYSLAVLALTCVFSAAFGWSWGPLAWVIPGEIFPVEIRSAGQGISVAVNLGATFLLTQTFLSMLCALKYATFIYYAAWVAVMTAFVVAFLPETKGVPLEAMGAIWERHWYWRRFVQPPPAKTTAEDP